MSVRLAPPLAALVILLVAWQAPAATDAGYEAFQDEDCAAAIEPWMPGAKAGAAARQYGVGAAYERLDDRGKAARWYAKAATQDYGQAVERLIVVPFIGGYNQDAVLEAFGAFADRARGGDPTGLYDFARYHEAKARWYKTYKNNKDLDNADMRAAWALYRLAAQYGHPTAKQEASRVWPHLITKVGRDHAEALVDRWRASLIK